MIDLIAENDSKLRDTYLKHVLAVGIAFIYEGMQDSERAIITSLYESGAVQVLVSTYRLCWDITLTAHLVVVLDNTRYDGAEKRYIDYGIPDVLQMLGRHVKVSHAQQSQSTGVPPTAILLCQAPKKEFYKKFLSEPLPVESTLNQYLPNHICAEIVAKTITSK
jgi:pre-mRNA-splicing helicase BRR2